MKYRMVTKKLLLQFRDINLSKIVNCNTKSYIIDKCYDQVSSTIAFFLVNTHRNDFRLIWLFYLWKMVTTNMRCVIFVWHIKKLRSMTQFNQRMQQNQLHSLVMVNIMEVKSKIVLRLSSQHLWNFAKRCNLNRYVKVLSAICAFGLCVKWR